MEFILSVLYYLGCIAAVCVAALIVMFFIFILIISWRTMIAQIKKFDPYKRKDKKGRDEEVIDMKNPGRK